MALFEKNHHLIDLVILDVIMPDMGGEETFNELKKDRPFGQRYPVESATASTALP